MRSSTQCRLKLRPLVAAAVVAAQALTGCGGGGSTPVPVTYNGAQIATAPYAGGVACMVSASGLLVGTTRYDIRLTSTFTQEFPDPSKVGIQWANPTLTTDVLNALKVALDTNKITAFCAAGIGWSSGFEAPYASPKESGGPWKTILLNYLGATATPPVPASVAPFDTYRDPYTGLVAVISIAK